MKRILKFFLGAVIASASIGAAQAQAIAAANVVVSPTRAMDITDLRSADLTPGAETFTTDTGTVRITLGNVKALTGSEAYKSWIDLSGLYGKPMAINPTAANWSDCIGGATHIDWKRGGLQVINDQCVLAKYIHLQSRR